MGYVSALSVSADQSMESYNQLFAVVETLIDQFGGARRLRGVKTALLIYRASEAGTGITVSEIARETDAPLENVRRHIASQVEIGTLRYTQDPDDERIARVLVTDPLRGEQVVGELTRRLAAIDWNGET